MKWRRWSEVTHPDADPMLRAVRARLAVERAPATLRRRIEAMLAREQLAAGPGEPCPE